MNRLLHKDLTDGILKAFYDVYNRLGFGFAERVYENSLVHELRKRGYLVAQQYPITVWYDGLAVGEFFADVIVDEKVILELKAAERIVPEHEAQLLNYLRATCIEVGLLLNFGPEPEFRRRVFELARKSTAVGIQPNHPH